MRYGLAGFEVVGVDINSQPHYPHDFIQADALALDDDFLASFDAFHASPPCQKYTKKTATWGRRRVHWEEHPDLIDATRERLAGTGKPYVIENVDGSPVRASMMLCGTMFGLTISKHRYFETNFPFFELMPPCNHNEIYNPWSGAGRTADKLREAQGTPWLPMHGGASRKRGYTGDLNNAIPPAYTEFIGKRLMEHLRQKTEA